jgi:hypothetical protein
MAGLEAGKTFYYLFVTHSFNSYLMSLITVDQTGTEGSGQRRQDLVLI